MFKEQIDDYPFDDDAFDDTCVSTMPPRPVRFRKSSSLADNLVPSVHHRPSYSSLFSFPETDSIGSPTPHNRRYSTLFSFPETDSIGSPTPRHRRYSSTSSSPSVRLSSFGSLSSLGPSSTPGSIQEFVIPRRTTPPRPHTLTSRGEILSQIDRNKLEGYHSVILREMRGGVLPKNHLERPVCSDITSFDFDILTKNASKRRCDSLRGFEF